jgi:hypothetical protein
MKDRSNQIEQDGSATVKLQETCDAEIASSTIPNRALLDMRQLAPSLPQPCHRFIRSSSDQCASSIHPSL